MGFSCEAHPTEDFIAGFTEVTDPRQDNVRHDRHEILMIALCTMLCGGEECSDIPLFGRAKEPFLRQFLTLRHGSPSHDTFSRVLRLLDPAAFAACFTRFMHRFADKLQGVVAIDGKTLRRSFDRHRHATPSHPQPGKARRLERLHEGKLKRAGWNDAFLTKLLAAFGSVHMR